jgi:carboxylesterase type B
MNVRYGDDPPRFGKPDFPPNGTIYPHRDSPDGISCIQIDVLSMKNQPGGRPKLEVPRKKHAPEQDEDCLFLDIYAPRKNFDKDGHPIDKLPVIVFFPGGAYAFGSKDLGGKLPLYSGRSILNEGKNKAVYVVGNYRLGAFGWLAGSYMETAGQPNAGLYDQALLLEWVQEYIVQAGGDPDRVTAWGQSTGGGSIMHHLTREGGTKDPLFHNVMLQSPAFEWSYDNSTDGTLDNTYRKFSRLAGCNYTYDIDCLRKQSRANLTAANQELFVEVGQSGILPIGPSVDGKWIRTIPATSFANGKLFLLGYFYLVVITPTAR